MKAITVFSHTRKTKDGRSFEAYSTTLTKKTGERVYADVKFRRECPLPTHFPATMRVKAGNVATKTVGDKLYYILWVVAWEEAEEDEDYNNLDEFA